MSLSEQTFSIACHIISLVWLDFYQFEQQENLKLPIFFDMT